MAKINYDALPTRVCIYCKKEYKPTGPAQKNCNSCRKHLRNVAAQMYRDIQRFKKFGTYGRIGQGMTNKKGSLHPQYKTGVGFFHKVLSPAAKTRRFCERCGKDLKDLRQWGWAAHHRDHDKTNNVINNIELLCSRCHLVEHKCWEHLGL